METINAYQRLTLENWPPTSEAFRTETDPEARMELVHSGRVSDPSLQNVIGQLARCETVDEASQVLRDAGDQAMAGVKDAMDQGTEIPRDLPLVANALRTLNARVWDLDDAHALKVG